MAYTTIDNPADYFNTVLYTGNGSTNAITGVGFQPDFIWCKARSIAYDHRVYNSISGVGKYNDTGNTGGDSSDANSITAFGTDGFTLGSEAGGNVSSQTFVSWNWLGGGTASSNTDGDITSSVSANTTAGFSIVSYTGNGSATQTIGHGLGAVPKVMIFKRTNTTSDWIFYHVTRGATKYIPLNRNTTGSAYEPYFANTEPTSSVFTVDTAGDINGSGNTFIAYLFSEIKGYSKFGSYTGNGNADGVFIYTGFKPAWIMVKRTDSTNNWMIIDNKRTPSNTGTVPEVFADLGDAENNSTDGRFDYLSNGLKARGTNAVINASGGTYIYMAFAEAPFVSSGGIPTTAR